MAGELEESRRFGFIGAASFECLQDDLLFYLIETNASIGQDYRKFLRLNGALLDPVRVEKLKMASHDHVVIFKQDDPFDGVAKFSYIAGPRMIHQKVLGLGIEASEFLPVFVVELFHKYTGKQKDILTPFAQRGQVDLYRCQPEVKIFAEAALLGHMPEVLVAGGDNPDVHLLLPGPPHGEKFPFFHHPKQFGLDLRVKIHYFVQKEGPAIGNLEQAFFAF